MLKLEEVKGLNKLWDREKKAVSVYLNTDQRLLTPEEIKIKLKNLFKGLEKSIDSEYINKIQDFINLRLKLENRGLAFFISRKNKLWKIIPLPKSVKNEIYVGKRLYLRPLLELLDEFERYCTVVVDKEKARIFTVYLGEIEEQSYIFDEFIGKHARGGWAQARWQRHIEDHVRRHLKKVALQTYKFFRKNKFDRLIIAGSKEILPEYEHVLHNYLKNKLAGKFYTELFAPVQKFLDQSLKIEEKTEREKEKELVDKLVNTLGRKNKGVIGLENTLLAVQEGKALILLINSDFKKTGSRCKECNYLDINPDQKICSYCKGKMEKVDDIAGRLAEIALDKNVRLEFVKNNPDLKKIGGIGALLRFR